MTSYGARPIGAVLLVAFLFALGFLVACASGPRLKHKHEFTLSPGQEHHAGLVRALLLPIDATNDEPVRGLDVENPRITATIVRHLESKGITVEHVDGRKFQELTTTAVRKVRTQRKSGASGVVSANVEFGDIVPELLAGLGESPDLVIAPNLLMRSAKYQGSRTIVWDGVRRRETIRNITWDEGSGTGAASLHVSVYIKDGTRVFSGFGGLEPVFRIDAQKEKYIQREDLFQDERNLKEGTCIAFYPYFGMDEYCMR